MDDQVSSKGETKFIFLTGAPLIHELDANDLISDALPPLQRFIEATSSCDHLADPIPSHRWPNWRRLEVVSNTEEPQDVDVAQGHDRGAQFSFLSLASQHSQLDLNKEFLDYSLAIYSRHAEEDADKRALSFKDSTFANETFVSDISEDSSMEPTAAPSLRLPTSVTNLKALPQAVDIEKSYPQTITVDVLVSIISVAPIRTVESKKSGLQWQLVEVIVGDESRPGFEITFWLPRHSNTISVKQRQMQEELLRLRSGHTVLMTNVALCVWQGAVFGQSLKSVQGKRIGTEIMRLENVNFATKDPLVKSSLPFNLLKKQERVQTWVSNFLLLPTRDVAKQDTHKHLKTPAKRLLAAETQLPPDTL